MIPYGTDLNDISVTGTYMISNQMKTDNNPRHYLIIPGIVVQQILDAERKKRGNWEGRRGGRRQISVHLFSFIFERRTA